VNIPTHAESAFPNGGSSRDLAVYAGRHELSETNFQVGCSQQGNERNEYTQPGASILGAKTLKPSESGMRFCVCRWQIDAYREHA
jgi:hypothetical protein